MKRNLFRVLIKTANGFLMLSFTQKEICAITGLKPRQVQWIVGEGLITPGVDVLVMRGGTRKYTSTNMIDFAIIYEFLAFRITKEIIREALFCCDNLKFDIFCHMFSSKFRDTSATMFLFFYKQKGSMVAVELLRQDNVTKAIPPDLEGEVIEMQGRKKGLNVNWYGALNSLLGSDSPSFLMVLNLMKVYKKIGTHIDWKEVLAPIVEKDGVSEAVKKYISNLEEWEA